MREYIKKEAIKLIKKYKTRNPFEIAKNENIIVILEELGSINGYYNKFARQKFIHINLNLSEQMQIVTCAHELGHSRLHPNANTPLFRKNTFYSINKLEKQANYFASELLIDADNFIGEYTINQLASYYKVPIELIKIKYNVF